MPALKDAGFKAYRVDEDPAPDVLMDAIEDLIEEMEDERDDYTYSGVHVTSKGWDWIKEHDHLFLPPSPPDDDFEADIPF